MVGARRAQTPRAPLRSPDRGGAQHSSYFFGCDVPQGHARGVRHSAEWLWVLATTGGGSCGTVVDHYASLDVRLYVALRLRPYMQQVSQSGGMEILRARAPSARAVDGANYWRVHGAGLTIPSAGRCLGGREPSLGAAEQMDWGLRCVVHPNGWVRRSWHAVGGDFGRVLGRAGEVWPTIDKPYSGGLVVLCLTASAAGSSHTRDRRKHTGRQGNNSETPG